MCGWGGRGWGGWGGGARAGGGVGGGGSDVRGNSILNGALRALVFEDVDPRSTGKRSKSADDVDGGGEGRGRERSASNVQGEEARVARLAMVATIPQRYLKKAIDLRGRGGIDGFDFSVMNRTWGERSGVVG